MRGTQNPPLTSWGCRGMPATPVMLRHGKIVCNAVIAYREVCRVSRVSESECGGRLCSSGRKPREHNHTAGMMNHGTGQSIKISLFFRRCAVFFLFLVPMSGGSFPGFCCGRSVCVAMLLLPLYHLLETRRRESERSAKGDAEKQNHHHPSRNSGRH